MTSFEDRQKFREDGGDNVRRHIPFRVALETFQTRLARGDWPMGMHLQIQPLAEELRFSTTPVREALAFLAGQGVIEESRGTGYVTLRLDARQLSQAYELHGWLLDDALREAAKRSRWRGDLESKAADPRFGGDPAVTFQEIVAATGHAALMRAHRSVTLLLGRPRRAESNVFDDWRSELAGLAAACRDRAPEALAPRIRAYHERRMRHLPDILMEVAEQDANISGI